MISIFDPMAWLSAEEYTSVTEFIKIMVMNGLFARILSASFLVIGCWFIFRRKQITTGLAFIALSVAVIFGGSLLTLIKVIYA